MSNREEAKLARWPAILPFLTGAVLFDGLGWWIMDRSETPITQWVVAAVVICVGVGAWMSVMPFIWDARASLKLDELDMLEKSSGQIRNLEKLTGQITIATSQWMTVQEHSDRAVESAKKIADDMSEEAVRFAEFMKQANDKEKATLRLEVEKLKRTEGDWLEIVVRILDHIFALYQAALRSGQENVIQQLTNFQNACLDAARRVGLVPFVAQPNEAFDAKRFQPMEGDQEVTEGATVAQTIAVGYSFQGQQIRRAIVALMPTEPGDMTDEAETGSSAETVIERKPEEPRLL